MTHKKIVGYLSELFVPRAEGLDGMCFNDDFLHAEGDTQKHAIYESVSNAQRESDLTFDFSYKVAEKAVNILQELKDFEDISDNIHKLIESEVPIYNGEVMDIYTSDSWTIDEGRESGMINNEGDTMTQAQDAWRNQIYNMVYAIADSLANCYEFETE